MLEFESGILGFPLRLLAREIYDKCINKVGKDKVMLGTDYPFPLGDLEPGKLIESSDYNDKTKEMILSENSLDWLGLPQNYYI